MRSPEDADRSVRRTGQALIELQKLAEWKLSEARRKKIKLLQLGWENLWWLDEDIAALAELCEWFDHKFSEAPGAANGGLSDGRQAPWNFKSIMSSLEAVVPADERGQCPDCNGKGRITEPMCHGGRTYECPNCKGTGRCSSCLPVVAQAAVPAESCDLKGHSAPPVSDELLEWLRGKIARAESELRAREQAAVTWRSGTNESWAAAAAIHPDTRGKPMSKKQRMEVAERESRIAAKCRKEVLNFKAVLSAVSHPDRGSEATKTHVGGNDGDMP